MTQLISNGVNFQYNHPENLMILALYCIFLAKIKDEYENQ